MHEQRIELFSDLLLICELERALERYPLHVRNTEGKFGVQTLTTRH